MKKIYIAPDIIVKMIRINSCMLTTSNIKVSSSSASSSYVIDDGNNDVKFVGNLDKDSEW